MKFFLLFISVFATTFAADASVILLDPFSNGDLPTYTSGVNGGFYIIGSGGAATEVGGNEVSRISNAPQGTPYGVLSSNTVSLGSDDLLRTTWVVTDSSLKANAESLVFTWQTEDVYTDTPAVSLVLDLTATNATLYVGGTPSASDNLAVDFGLTNDTFTVIAEFSSERFDVRGTDKLRTSGEGPLEIGDSWTAPPLSNLRVGAFVNGRSKNGLVVEFDSVTVEAIPEPAVITLIAFLGSGLLVWRRLFAG